MTELKYKKEHNIAVIKFDTPGDINTLNQVSLNELAKLVAEINKDDAVHAVCLTSNKKDNFLAGADINELMNVKSQKEAALISKKVQQLLNEIANSKKPYVAAINGACLGGGLEVALACHYRIATRELKTLFATPEVMLGLLPGAGATQRLPRQIGITNALDLLLSGKKVTAQHAKSMGLVDFLVDTREELFNATMQFIERIALKQKKPEEKKLGFWSLLPLYIAKIKVQKKTRGFYKAPFAIIDAINTGIRHGFNAGLKEEAKQFGILLNGEVSKNLMRLFFAQKERQKNPYDDVAEKNYSLGIAGAGLMGSGIASVSLLYKQKVFLFDKVEVALSKARAHVFSALNQRLKKGRLSHIEFDRAMSNLSTGQDLEAFSTCDVIIEAIAEKLEAKRELLKAIEAKLLENGIFASNTSSIPISEIALFSNMKDRILGMHYFSPVEKMPLLEIVKTKDTSTKTLALACAVGVKQKKTMIIVNDSAGFYTTRVIASLFDEACILLLEGKSLTEVDEQWKSIGFLLGPFELMDEVGIDIGYHVAQILSQRIGLRLVNADAKFSARMIELGFLGKKSGKGFYIHKNHKKELNGAVEQIAREFKRPKNPAEDKFRSGERMFMRFVNEAAFCLSEDIIRNPEDGDVGAVFGLGFPPFLGGPFRYIEKIGKQKLAKKLSEMKEVLGERFEQAPFLR